MKQKILQLTKINMKIYKIWQIVNYGYDTYSDAVVCAESEYKAKRINPGGFREMGEDDKWYFVYADGEKKLDDDDSWAELKDIKVEYIGEAKEGLEEGILCSSFHAG